MQSPTELSLIKPLGKDGLNQSKRSLCPRAVLAGYQRNRSCGYCKNSHGSSSYYISCDKLRVDHYQELVDRGWRRSGATYYKPDLLRSCCPHYTIRLDSAAFKATRDQRKVLHRWNRFILGVEYPPKAARLCPLTREEKTKRRSKFDLTLTVHASESTNLKRPTDPRTKKPIEPAHKFEVSLEADAFSIEKWNVFLAYQMKVHKEPNSRWSHQSFKRFLCSGLDRKVVRTDGSTQRLGSYHQCYRLDGKLIAVGVLDLLPRGVSSVYLFYDPDFEEWQLGKLSALREIALASEEHYKYYYMGYYIHTCVKMRYKGAYRPTSILDPETLEWGVFDDEYRTKLDRHPYVSLSREKRLGEEALSRQGVEDVAKDGPESQELLNGDQVHRKTSSTSPSITPAASVPDNKDYELDSEPSDEDTEIPEGSLFDYGIPGVLKGEEVIKLDLDHWKLLVRNTLIDFEDLKGWEESSIRDQQSIKGIVAELAATIGPEVMKNSAVSLF